MKKSKKKQAFTTAPKEGKKKSFGHGMGGLFGVTAKKPEADMKPPTRSQTRSARNARLSGKLI